MRIQMVKEIYELVRYLNNTTRKLRGIKWVYELRIKFEKKLYICGINYINLLHFLHNFIKRFKWLYITLWW